ncbi:hypothetical protein RIF29_33970 [Crotalaria pallida]|uniref:Uncharacterized protein n=1 Tax=Crotalaria pallida TaxID=3830 RepID=A0AAN9EE85_CROPI
MRCLPSKTAHTTTIIGVGISIPVGQEAHPRQTTTKLHVLSKRVYFCKEVCQYRSIKSLSDFVNSHEVQIEIDQV